MLYIVRGEIVGRYIHLGIKTPLLHRISSAPNGCVPSIYCNGFPRARSRHIRQRCCGHVVSIWPEVVSVTWQFARACSRSQRSSLSAEGRSRHVRRRRGSRACCARARWMRAGGRRGMHFLVKLGVSYLIGRWVGTYGVNKHYLNRDLPCPSVPHPT